MSPFPRSQLRGQEVPPGRDSFRDVLYDIADITAQQCAEGIQGVGGYMHVFFQPSYLARAEIVMFDQSVLSHALGFHGCPQPVIAYHGLSSFWLLKSVKPGFSMAIINKWIIP